MRNPLTLSLFFLIASCSNVPVEVGSGPIELSPRAQNAYEEYASSRKPDMFVVTEDGKYFQYSYCREARCRSGGGTARAIAECQVFSKGQRCYVYDRGGNIVWERDKPSKGNDKAVDLCSKADQPPEIRVESCSEALAASGLSTRDRALTHRRRAFAYNELKQYKKAINDLNALLEKDGLANQLDMTERSLARWYVDRGQTHELLNDLDSAKSDFLKAAEYSPDWPVAEIALKRVSY